jgi:hypothetical protein
MAVTLRIILTDEQADFFGYPHGAEVYFEDYDIEVPWPEGVNFTGNIHQAKCWDHVMSAMEAWRAQSKTIPIRDTDGKANRPLTAFTVTIEFIDDAER